MRVWGFLDLVSGVSPAFSRHDILSSFLVCFVHSSLFAPLARPCPRPICSGGVRLPSIKPRHFDAGFQSCSLPTLVSVPPPAHAHSLSCLSNARCTAGGQWACGAGRSLLTPLLVLEAPALDTSVHLHTHTHTLSLMPVQLTLQWARGAGRSLLTPLLVLEMRAAKWFVTTLSVTHRHTSIKYNHTIAALRSSL